MGNDGYGEMGTCGVWINRTHTTMIKHHWTYKYVGLKIAYVGKFMCLLRFMYCYVFWCSSMAFVSYHYWNPVLVLVYVCVLYGQYCRLLDGMYTYIYMIWKLRTCGFAQPHLCVPSIICNKRYCCEKVIFIWLTYWAMATPDQPRHVSMHRPF